MKVNGSTIIHLFTGRQWPQLASIIDLKNEIKLVGRHRTSFSSFLRRDPAALRGTDLSTAMHSCTVDAPRLAHDG
jgi:hypothetical protein